MKRNYEDITSRIAEEPQWFDENGTPRYGPFDPGMQSDLYAQEVVLLAIECQNCERRFEVCVSDSPRSLRNLYLFKSGQVIESLADLIRTGHIHYGDPPNIGCCASGPTMGSVQRRVLQYWRRVTPEERKASLAKSADWKSVDDAAWALEEWRRDATLEVEVHPDWDDEDR